jgi:thiamine phosphate synthase YjbQ (UPF0047 family)
LEVLEFGIFFHPHTTHTLTESELLAEKEALEDVAQQMEELVEARASAHAG